MRWSVASVIRLALHASSALALVTPRAPARAFRCGSENPPAELLAQAEEFAARVAPQETTALAAISVNTYFHVVTSAAKQGQYSQTQLSNQLSYLNNAYAARGISFTLISTDYTTNDVWAAGDADIEMKTALRKGNYADLNVYFISNLGDGLLGFCYFPTNAPRGSTNFIRDGCVSLADTLPGGPTTNYNRGGTTAHEVGHWFGLFHVFQGQSCTGSGDSVADTPQQRAPTRGCPTSSDTCPNATGLDSVNNYMDYSYDSCYTNFTPGQGTRMNQMFNMYRAGK